MHLSWMRFLLWGWQLWGKCSELLSNKKVIEWQNCRMYHSVGTQNIPFVGLWCTHSFARVSQWHLPDVALSQK